MTDTDLTLRMVVAGTAALVFGAALVVLAAYARALRRRPGSLLMRHIVETAAGLVGLVATIAVGVYDQIPGVDLAWPDQHARLWLFLASLLMLLVALLDGGRYVRRR